MESHLVFQVVLEFTVYPRSGLKPKKVIDVGSSDVYVLL